MHIALAQIDAVIGDFDGNRRKILAAVDEARIRTPGGLPGLVIVPELSLCGYPPLDLLDQECFAAECMTSLRLLQRSLPEGIALAVGHVDRNRSGSGRSLYNAMSVIKDGRVVFSQAKTLLPTYDVFDEARYFESARERRVFRLAGLTIGFAICEDLWWEAPPSPDFRYTIDPVKELLDAGADLLIVPSASPFVSGKLETRLRLAVGAARSGSIPVLYCNLCGANDSLVFDGRSFAVDACGSTVAMAGWGEEVIVLDSDELARPGTDRSSGRPESGVLQGAVGASGEASASENVGTQGEASASESVGASGVASASESVGASGVATVGNLAARFAADSDRGFPPSTVGLDADFRMEEIGRALVAGIAGYMKKCGFSRACLGLSGGIDSALVAVLAALAVGPENVTCISMPSRFSSGGSVDDSVELCRIAGMRMVTLPIEGPFMAYLDLLAPSFAGTAPGLAEENLQARIRGTLLMAWSNKFGQLLLTTGNKSEIAVGYCTLYGDMCGALAPIGDLLKTDVYALSRHLNRSLAARYGGQSVIPEPILAKPPSAELRYNQTDQDSLPPYDLLDAILELYVERELSCSAIVARGFDRELVERVVLMTARAEYKRRQAAPVLKVSCRAFGLGRRMPIARVVHEVRS